MAGPIQLDVVTPERRVLETEVDEVILPGLDGYLGVRPGHTPLLAALAVGELSYVQAGTTHHAVLCGGYVEVLPDRVSVLTEAAEISSEIDKTRAEASLAKAETILQEIQDAGESRFKRARARLERAATRISVAGK